MNIPIPTIYKYPLWFVRKKIRDKKCLKNRINESNKEILRCEKELSDLENN